MTNEDGLEALLQTFCETRDISVEEFKCTRVRHILEARQEFMYILKTSRNMLNTSIAKFMNCKPSTVSYSIRTHCIRQRAAFPKNQRFSAIMFLATTLKAQSTHSIDFLYEVLMRARYLGFQAGKYRRIKDFSLASKQPATPVADDPD